MELKKKVPELRFKGFSGEWEELKLNQVSEIIGGGTPSTIIPEFWDGDIDWYSPTEIGDKVYAEGSVKKITALGLENSSAKILPANKTVLFTSRAGIGDMAILKKDGATNQGFQSFVIKEDNDPYFVYSKGHLIKDYALKHASGSTFLEVSGKQLGNMNFYIPVALEQSRIGTWFQHLDQLITLHQKKYNKLTNIKKAMLEKMFPKNGADVPEIRFEGFKGKWEEKRLVDMVELIGTGKSVFTPFPEKSEHKPYAILGSRAVIGYDSEYDYSGSFILTARVGENAGKLYKYTGDVKITDNTVYIKGQNLEFIFYLLTSFSLEKLSFGTGQPLIKSSEFMNLKLMFSSEKKEQYLIGTYFQKLDQLITLQQTQIEKLQNIKKACLEKMFV